MEKIKAKKNIFSYLSIQIGWVISFFFSFEIFRYFLFLSRCLCRRIKLTCSNDLCRHFSKKVIKQNVFVLFQHLDSGCSTPLQELQEQEEFESDFWPKSLKLPSFSQQILMHRRPDLLFFGANRFFYNPGTVPEIFFSSLSQIK